MNILYFDCFSGISGDMALGALLDLGGFADRWAIELSKLRLASDSFDVAVEKTVKHAIRGTDVRVVVHGAADRGTAVLHGSADGGKAAHGHPEGGEAAHGRADGGKAAHGHPEGGAIGHHGERSLRDIVELIKASALNERVKESAEGVFREIAEAEGRVHGLPAEDVHFHEIGAVDSIVDIVGVCICIDMLGVERVCASELHDGKGHVMTRHGLLPVPVPAVMEMLRGARIPIVHEDVRAELATPTGVGILKYFAKTFGPMPPMRVIGAGYGFGKKETGRLNALRAVLGEAVARKPADGGKSDGGVDVRGADGSVGSGGVDVVDAATGAGFAPLGDAIGADIAEVVAPEIVSIEANIDDMTPEALGYAMERLLARGALDVYYTPIYMKKNRPATMLTALARVEDADALTDAIFEETTTIGVRKARLIRDVMARKIEKARVPGYGDVRVKVSVRKGVHRAAPEYEDVKAAALREGKSFMDVYEAAKMSDKSRKNGE